MAVRLTCALTLLLTAVSAQEIVTLTASDGQVLSAAYSAPTKTPTGGILLLHMYRSSRQAWRPIESRLAAAGFHVLAIDMRGHGRSKKGKDGQLIDVSRQNTSDPARNPFLKMHKDARAGLDFLTSKGAPKDRLAIVGASVGCSVALHTAKEHGDLVKAVVLMTPGSDYLSVPSLTHARSFGNRAALILSSEEEADKGARPLKAVMTGERVEQRLLTESGIHGTRMFGKVPTIEADIIEWLMAALVTDLELTVPVTKDLFIDGAVEDGEGVGATRLDIPLTAGKSAVVRISRNRKHLVFGFKIPERYIRKNQVIIYAHSGPVAASPTKASFKVSFSPADPERKPIVCWRGVKGAWEDAPTRGIQAYGNTRNRAEWVAEVALPLSDLLPKDSADELRLAFELRGQKKDAVRPYPPKANLDTSPASWVPTRVAKL